MSLIKLAIFNVSPIDSLKMAPPITAVSEPEDKLNGSDATRTPQGPGPLDNNLMKQLKIDKLMGAMI